MRKVNGKLAEAKVLSHFVSLGYECFLPFSDNSPVDLIVFKNSLPLLVSVKYTSSRSKSGNWNVTLKSVSRRAHNGVHVSSFKREEYNVLAVYVGPIDKVVLLDPSKVEAKGQIVIKESDDAREYGGVAESGL